MCSDPDKGWWGVQRGLPPDGSLLLLSMDRPQSVAWKQSNDFGKPTQNSTQYIFFIYDFRHIHKEHKT